ncbi:sulfatase family protein [Thalassoglobus polymorphus]|uniref:sulfatase family protein n=1 Tax=Thalassoglobus polymorphus TaxID=2527994 RepID=UPI001E659FFD|nr:sulfatase [Thalassoglobus polymorphus]
MSNFTLLSASQFASAKQPPNVVIIFTDDQGYADVGCFGSEGFETPNLDKMAAEGRKFTSFYVSQAVCGASRASLLTGCYSNRIGMLGAPSHRSTHGINQDEVLISELCKQKNYATALYGKWHLGHHEPFLPLQNGFDDYYGLPYSNDMWPFHPTSKAFPDLPMFEGNKIVNPKVTPEDQVHLTTSYMERALKFIDENHEDPFFLYVAHSMPHVPLFVSEKFKNKSEQGQYGDVIMEIDWSVGQILERLKQHGIDENTLVIFTSDNGPWMSYGNHAGSAKPLREGKGTAWEGGVRVPCIMRWPGKIPAGTTCNELAATIDLFPTIAKLINGKLPAHAIDGKDIWPLMSGEKGATTPHEYYCYYWGNELQCIRSGDWKLHFPHRYRSLTGEPGNDGLPNGYSQEKTGLALYNLSDDIGEKNDVKEQHPEVVAKLKEYANAARKELGDSRLKIKGTGYRAPGRLNNQ